MHGLRRQRGGELLDMRPGFGGRCLDGGAPVGFVDVPGELGDDTIGVLRVPLEYAVEARVPEVAQGGADLSGDRAHARHGAGGQVPWS